MKDNSCRQFYFKNSDRAENNEMSLEEFEEWTKWYEEHCAKCPYMNHAYNTCVYSHAMNIGDLFAGR